MAATTGTSRLETLKTLRVANLDVAFATAFAAFFTGTILIGFVKSLGGGDLWIGLIGAVPALMGVAQIPGAVLGRASRSFKAYIAKGGWAWRLLHILVVPLPFLPISAQAKLALVVLVPGVATLCNNLVGPIYNEWIGKIVPETSRGWYFSQRTLVSTVVGMIAGLLGARIVDIAEKNGQGDLGYTLVFGLGIVCALLSMMFFLQMKDATRAETVPVRLDSMVAAIKSPFADPNFRKIMAFIAVFCVGQGFAGQLFGAYALESLEMPLFNLQLTAVASALGTVATIRMMGFLSDKYGNKPVLVLLTIGVSMTPLIWLATGPSASLTQNTTILVAGHIFPGIFWPGIALMQMNLYLATSKEGNRADYLAAALTVQSVILFAAPIAGSAVMAVLRDVLGDPVAAYKWIFAATVVLRFVSIFPLLSVKEEGSAGIRSTLREILQARPRSVAALRTIRAGSGESERESAIKNLGADRLSMATTELASALRDPSPSVRREAAHAIGRIATPEAAEALVRAVEEHPHMVDEEMLEALGETSQRMAVPTLVWFLDDPSAQIRRSAAKALGRIGDSNAIEPLCMAAVREQDGDLRRAAIQALRRLGAATTEVYSQALDDPRPSVRTAAAEAVSELQLTALAPRLRDLLQSKVDSPSEIAYALGSVGGPQDLRIVLQSATLCESSTTRRRALLGAARLIGQEPELYRLLTLGEVARDTAILQKVKPFERRDTALREAVEAFSNGDEFRATALLAKAESDPVVQEIAAVKLEEAFLLAILVYLDLRPSRA